MTQGGAVKLPLGQGYHCLLTPGTVLPVKECKQQDGSYQCTVVFHYDLPSSPSSPPDMQSVVIGRNYVCRGLS